MIFIPGVPPFKRRHRTRNGRTYNPPENVAEAQWIALCARKVWGNRPLMTGPLFITIVAVYPRTKELMKKKHSKDRIRKITKPDFDNITKAILDGLEGILYANDATVSEGHASKWYQGLPECGIDKIGTYIWLDVADATQPIPDIS